MKGELKLVARSREVSRAEAKKIAEQTREAYAADSYRSWHAVIEMMANLGLTANQIIAVAFSKYPRWACVQGSSSELEDYLTRYLDWSELDQLVKDHFGGQTEVTDFFTVVSSLRTSSADHRLTEQARLAIRVALKVCEGHPSMTSQALRSLK